ncbi:hypothetical protein TGME49_248110 [Toxoplasma gondii ME49]|uniref:Maf1 regulator n=5 Tax=Toxoplasma gondii TaxID=5811 RepID=B6KH35_TOXGV|nr:hypothetical protein TGME49_248110 [Toxoplasma gondii ME49]EPT24977.1 hypothetical protein TGME49_248110 [Toxoplasma gondii ME49]ESS34316.1 Maf1 regulator [Toxoplasma gondii VEG]KYF49596.1 Maf1 regulator [Toxoplasma gondii ARI]CEL78440.1 TPA: hypothetical protein BN1205_003780 [Toxoplasma gondii VEG]|eukprot:XP_018634985.1 hypothetical protein TGME49_248110 [Toxoplasma gondii ME49]
MRFLDAPALTRLSALLQHLDVGDRVIRGRLELLSTCSQSCIERRQLAEEIEKEISSSPLFLASSSPQPILLSSPHGARAATLRGPRDGRGEKDACKEGGSSPNSRKKRKTSCSPSSAFSSPAFSSPAFSCTAFELPPRQLDLPRKLDDSGEEERAVESEPPRSRSARGRGRRADSGQTEEKAKALLGKKEGGSKGQHTRGNAEKNDSETLSDDEEHDGKDVLVNLIGALNQCFPDYEFCSALTPAMFEQAARVEDVQAEINRRLCVVERVVPGFLQQLWAAIKASIRLECTDIYFLRVGSSDDPAPLVMYDPASFSSASSFASSASFSSLSGQFLRAGGEDESQQGEDLSEKSENVCERRRREGGSLALRKTRRKASLTFSKPQNDAPVSGATGSGWSDANSISVFSLSFFFHDRSEEKLLFFTCNCTCKAARDLEADAADLEEENDIGDIHLTRAAFGLDDKVHDDSPAGEERDDLGEEDPDTLSDLELPSSACAYA